MFMPIVEGIISRATAGPWTPNSISGCVAWLDGSDLSTMWQNDARSTQVTTPGQEVAVWDDKSDAGNNWTQTSASLRPLFDIPYRIYFPASFLYGPNFSALTAGTVFFKAIQDAGYESGLGGIHHISAAGGTSSTGHYSNGTPVGDNRDTFGITTRTVPNDVWGTSGRPLADVDHVFCASAGSAQHKGYIDNIAIDTTAKTVGFGSTSVIGIGVRNSVYNAAYPFLGNIYSMIMYDTVLSDADRLTVFEYLRDDATPAYPTITDPTEITGCILWLDASDRGSTTDQWDDKSGEGNHFTSASGQFPTFIGGEAIFNGTSEFLTGPDFVSSLTEAETFWRVKQDNANPGLAVSALTEFGNNVNSCHYTYLSRIFEGFGNTSRAMDVNPPLSIDSYRTINIWTASNDWAYNHDGNRLYTTSTNTVGWITDPRIGKAKSFSRYFDGNAKAFVIFDHKLDADERYQMEAYMASL